MVVCFKHDCAINALFKIKPPCLAAVCRPRRRTRPSGTAEATATATARDSLRSDCPSWGGGYTKIENLKTIGAPLLCTGPQVSIPTSPIHPRGGPSGVGSPLIGLLRKALATARADFTRRRSPATPPPTPGPLPLDDGGWDSGLDGLILVAYVLLAMQICGEEQMGASGVRVRVCVDAKVRVRTRGCVCPRVELYFSRCVRFEGFATSFNHQDQIRSS